MPHEPADLGDAFSVGAARAAGITEKRLRGPAFIAPFHGVRVPAQPRVQTTGPQGEREDALRRVRAYAAIMPEHAFFIGPTAALIQGIPLPRGLHDVLHVGVEFPRTPPRRPGIRGRRVAVAQHVQVVGRLRAADPALTWATLAPHLGEYDLVAVTDHLLRIPRSPGGLVLLSRTEALATREQLSAILAENRWRGSAALRRALERARTGSSSRPETWTRLILVDAGLAEPALDHDVRDAHGRFLGCSDLAYPDRMIAIEYEGEGHRERQQFVRDLDRFSRYDEAGWRSVRLAATHVFRTPSEAVRRVRAALGE